jgi:glutamate 5-kinase
VSTDKSHQELGASRTWVIKIGSALVTDEGRGLNVEAFGPWVEQMVQLRQQGKQLLLVSSGAIAEGMSRLGWRKRPRALYEMQAAAAVGQMGLVQAYESRFARHGIRTAQVLLTHEDLADRRRYLNSRNALRTLLGLGVVPVINENDTVASEETRFGDNDTLAALVANLVEADLLVILTDQHGLYDSDPRHDPGARLLRQACAGDVALEHMAGSGSKGHLGSGGMLTKVRAAAKAARSGASTWMAWGLEPEVLLRLAGGEPLGTILHAGTGRVVARKQWLAGQLRMLGRVVLDAGAVRAVREQGKSLLPVGVTEVQGGFGRGDLVACVDQAGGEVARGLVNYDADDAAKIIGRSSSKIDEILGYVDEPELIHRDNLVVI